MDLLSLLDELELESENMSEEDEVELSDEFGCDGSSMDCGICIELSMVENSSLSSFSSVMISCDSRLSSSLDTACLGEVSSLIIVSSISISRDTI